MILGGYLLDIMIEKLKKNKCVTFHAMQHPSPWVTLCLPSIIHGALVGIGSLAGHGDQRMLDHNCIMQQMNNT